MNSLAELTQIKESMKGKVGLPGENNEGIRIVVGMATCGIAAGAKPIMNAFVEEVKKRNLADVTVVQTGCIGICQYEPVVEVYVPGKEKVTYVNMTVPKIAKIVNDHVVNGNIVLKYTIGAKA